MMEVTNFYNYGTMNQVEDGATQINHYYYNGETGGAKAEFATPSREDLAAAILACQKYFWANSSYAVLFCVCRDYFGYPDNMSQFEREIQELDFPQKPDYQCADNVIAGTFYNNDYMKLPVDHWKQSGAKERVLLLAEELKTELSNRLEKNKV